MKTRNIIKVSGLLALISIGWTPVSSGQSKLPDPDGKSADLSKPVQVFILMGQSNMLGFGKIKGGEGSLEQAVKEKGLYPYLIDETGNWTERKDVRNVRVMGSGGPGQTRVFNNEWMTIKGNIGPEMGIGHHVGHALEAPVMILKSCIGNRGLGWDLLPPGSESFEHTDAKGVTWVHPGYKGSPERWEKGSEPKKIGWYAGLQYDGDVARAKEVLADLNTYYPDARGYEVAGFCWWQGDRDSRNEALSSRYEKNLVQLIKQLRKDFKAPNAKFVTASLGQTKKGAVDGGGKILDAMFAVDGDSGKYPEFKGNVSTVYAHPLSKGSDSGSHYGGNAETYMNIGDAMGKAMVGLLKNRSTVVASDAPKSTKRAQAPEKAKNVPAVSLIEIDEPGFESDGSWKFGQTGMGVNGFFGASHANYINAGLIDPLPNRGVFFAYNNGPQHDLYQVLPTALGADTIYTLKVVAIHPSFVGSFPGGELRLGYVPDTDDGTGGDGVANDSYGEFLLKPSAVNNPTPVNGDEVDDGFQAWTWTFTTGANPAGLGQKLRVEILGGGGVQSLFDNVQLEVAVAKMDQRK